MSQSIHHICKTIPGSRPLEGKSIPCSGTSGKLVAVSLCPFNVNRQINTRIKIGSIKCASGAASFVCRASSGGPRRNSDFSRQNRQSFSRNRNRQNEERDNFDNLDESDLLTSRNGPLLSLSNNSKFQSTAAPGPREKEIVELFRKVQAKLRERAANKEDKKVEASKGKAKEGETVDSLLKLLRKHSIEQGKKKDGSFEDSAVEESEQTESRSVGRSTSFFKPSIKEKIEVPAPNPASVSRPPSNFRRKSPVPLVKFQPVYSNEDPVSSTSYAGLAGDKKRFEAHPETAQQSESDTEKPELELEQELESSYADGTASDESSEEESSDVDDSIDEDADEEKENEHEDLSLLKLTELRALAKSRGLKGFSKMKKGGLVDLLSSSSV